MPKQTSIEWLEMELKKLPSIDVLKTFEKAKQMHKEEITKAFDEGYDLRDTDGTLLYHDGASTRYYQETYGGNHIVDTNEMIDHIGDANEMVEISDEEIIKLANEHILYNNSKRQWIIEGMKLYKEQLKRGNNES